MTRYLVVFSSFVTMLCLGGIYAWSIIASELIKTFNYSVLETQIVFGSVILIFPITMLFVNYLKSKISVRYLMLISGGLFLVGYLLSGFSNGNFVVFLLGYGVVSAVATGIGYWISLNVPVYFFPNKKGLVKGIATAGFGIGAVVLSFVLEILIDRQYKITDALLFIALVYSPLIMLLSRYFEIPEKEEDNTNVFDVKKILFDKKFLLLIIGIFLGTFGGLLIISNLKLIAQQTINNPWTLAIGITIFSIANFTGRLVWGGLSDYIITRLNIFLALLLQAIGIFLMANLYLNSISYFILTFLIGFGFGGNFVLFANETVKIYGVTDFGKIYPFVFLGYAIAGLAGPIVGGALFELKKSYTLPIIVASLVSLVGSIMFLVSYLKLKFSTK